MRVALPLFVPFTELASLAPPTALGTIQYLYASTYCLLGEIGCVYGLLELKVKLKLLEISKLQVQHLVIGVDPYPGAGARPWRIPTSQ